MNCGKLVRWSKKGLARLTSKERLYWASRIGVILPGSLVLWLCSGKGTTTKIDNYLCIDRGLIDIDCLELVDASQKAAA
jgi:hypothetical protein